MWPYQVLGVSCVLLIFAIVFSGMAYSKLFNVFMKTPEQEEKEPEWVDVSAKDMPDQQAADGNYTNMATLEESATEPPDSGGYVNAELNDEDGGAVLT